MEYETPQFYRVMQYAARADRDVVGMVSGSPDWEPPEALREGLREYADAGPDAFQYQSSLGLPELRTEIADRRGVDRSQVMVTNGAAEANHLAMAGGLATFPGEEVLLTDPVYPYYAGRANFLGAETTFVPVEDDGHLDPATVEAHAGDDTAVIVVNTPNNPMGVTYDAETMAALVDVAEAHDALLVSDEVYDHFDHSGRFASALATDSAHRLVTNAFSKSLAITGWRVGYAVFPPEQETEEEEGQGQGDEAARAADLFDDATTRHMLTTITGSRPAQAAVHHALTETGPDYFQGARDRVKGRVDALTDALDDVGAAYTEPEGAFYVMAALPSVPGTFAGVERLIDEAGVAGMPGEAFGEARADWVRFSVTTDRVETAGERLRSYLG